MLKYIVSLYCKDYNELNKKLRECFKKSDLVEIRIDYIPDFDISCIKNFDLSKVIITLRSKSNGGFFECSEEQRIRILKTFLNKVGYIDVEYDVQREDLKWFLENRTTTKIILSYHNFNKVPANLEDVIKKLMKQKADIIKVISTCRDITDNIKIVSLINKYKNKTKLIIHNMGETGKISRIIGGLTGNEFTFTSFGNEPTAPGQIPIDKLKNEYYLDRIKKRFKIVGLIGNPVKHSYSYHIHNFAFNASGLNYLYLNFLVKDLNKFFDYYKEMFVGLSVTSPYKISVIPFLDEISGNAKLIGAVNSVQKIGKKLYGHNTDSAGFGYALSKHSNITNKNIVVLGAGGVARAVVVKLLDRKNNITILNRTLSKAKKLAKEFNCQYSSLDDIKNCAPNILINCTSVGMYPNINESPIGNTKLKNCLVFDTIYNPYHTKLLKDAIKNGNKIISGFDMFLRQAELQYLLFTSSQFDFFKYKKRFIKSCRIIEKA